MSSDLNLSTLQLEDFQPLSRAKFPLLLVYFYPLIVAYAIEIIGLVDVALYITGLHAILAIMCFVWVVGELETIEY